MLMKAATLVLCGIAVKWFLSYRDWLNWQTSSVLKVAPGPCSIVMQDGGSEYVTHIGNGKVLFTSGLELYDSNGSVKLLDLAAGNKVTTLKVTNGPKGRHLLPSAHGMSVWRDPDTDELLVYVLTHTAAEDRVVVFELTSSMELRYIKTITDPSFVFMNDLAIVGRDQFYITSYWHSRRLWLISIEIYLRINLGKIYFYDGTRARVVSSGYTQPNGINTSPDKKFVYMAECGGKKIWAYKRLPNNELEVAWNHQLDTCVDNIEVDPTTGDLWIGATPLWWRIVDAYNIFNLKGASQVLRVKLKDNAVRAIEEIYADDGDELTQTASATYVDGKLVIGTVASQTAVCDVKYLSP